MAKKKTKAQLNREIDMALHKRNVTALRQARSDPGAHEPAIDALLERGYSLERAKKAVKPYAKAPSAKAVDFFRKHAGYAQGRGEAKATAQTRRATALARAEAEAEDRGWTVTWEDDPEEWQGDDERPFEVLVAVLRDANGNVLGSLGNIGMSGNTRTDRDYARVIEAELAEEAL